MKSRYTVVCCAAQENGASANRVSILTETTKLRFSRIRSSVIPHPNGTKFTVELASTRGRPDFKFYEDPSSRFQDMSQQNFVKIYIFFSFRTLCVNCYNSHMCASIWLKFGTRIGGLNVNNRIKFGINLTNIRGVTSDFTHLTKLNFCQAYRLNCFKEQAENRYVARLNIRGVSFGS